MLEFEFGILEWFYKIGNKFFDIFFYIISQLGGSVFLIAILGIIYWCFDKEKGEKIGYAILTSVCLNGLIKSFVNSKRPFMYEGREHLQKFKNSKLSDSATGSSFPSGHSQIAGSLYGSIMISFKKKWIRIVCIVLMILIPISRLYLGVHFPNDIVVGLILGLLVTFLSFFLLNRFPQKKFLIYLITSILFLPFMFFKNAEHDFIRGYGLFVGFCLGAFVENKCIKFSTDITPLKKVIRTLVGIFFVGITFVITQLIPDSISHIPVITILIYGLIAFLAIGVIPFLFKSEKNPNGI